MWRYGVFELCYLGFAHLRSQLLRFSLAGIVYTVPQGQLKYDCGAFYTILVQHFAELWRVKRAQYC